MKDIGFIFAGARFCLCYPDDLAESISLLLRDIERADAPGNEKAVEILGEGPGESFRIISSANQSDILHGHQRLLEALPSFLKREIFAALAAHCLISGAALSADGKLVFFPAARSSGRSMLAAALVSRGWRYRTDECMCLGGKDEVCRYLAMPPSFRPDDWPAVLAQLGVGIEHWFPGTKRYHIVLNSDQIDASSDLSLPALIVFPRYLSGARYHLEALSAARAAAELMRCAVHPNQMSFQLTAALTRKVRCLRLTFGDSAQLEHLERSLGYIADAGLTSTELEKFLANFQPVHSNPVRQPEPSTTKSPSVIPAATAVGEKKVLTIGMATYDDFDGVYFTAQAIRLYHPEVTEQTEILVIDNHPGGPTSQALKSLEDIIVNYRYFPFGSWKSPAVKHLVFCQANADFVLCLDGHVMVQPGALQRLIDYFRDNQDSRDLLQGPMYSESLKSLHTHFEPIWREGMFGRWGIDKRAEDPDAPPFDIPMQGCGFFACRKDAWVGFNPRFRGFGGEEGYIHEKFRQHGGRTLCVPFLRWLHRFARPAGVPYRIDWHDRIFNYMVGLDELGLDSEPLHDHFKEHLGEGPTAQILAQVEQEMGSPFFYFDAIYCITKDPAGSRWEKMLRRFKALGIDASIRTFRAVATPDNHHIGCALSHRAVIEEAQQQCLEHVLVFEDDVLFLNDTLDILADSMAELKQRNWNLFYLGGHRRGKNYPLADGCSHLSVPTDLTSTHGVAYSKQVFEKILTDLPESSGEMLTWLESHQGIANYLSGFDQQFICEPPIATTAELLPAEKEEYQKRFTLGE